MIHLVVPGLLGSFPRFTEQGPVPPLPALDRLFARGDREQAPDSFPQVLFHLFGASAEEPLSTAAVAFHADNTGMRETRYLLHADPIHLRPDQDRLLAFDFHHQRLQQGAAQPFVEAFNAHFRAEGLELLAPHPTRWYLAMEEAPKVQFHPLSSILGRNVDPFLPQGAEAGEWRVRMNEVQMLFHGLPQNSRREAAGLFAVNGLWFSGGGFLPDRVVGGSVDPDAVLSDGDLSDDCPLAAGLARLARETGADTLRIEQGPGRAVLDGDREAWLEAVASLDTELAEAMGGDVCVYPCDGSRLRWMPGMRRRWWRPRKPLETARLE